MLLLLFCSNGIAQERFNVRYDSEFPSTLFSSVLEVDNGYISIGFVSDSSGVINGRPSIYAKFNHSGELIFQTSYGGEELLEKRRFSSQNPDLQFLNDSVLIHSGVTYDENWVRQGYLMKSNLEGDTLEMMRFYSPNFEEEYPYNSITTSRLAIDSEGDFLVLSGILNQGGTGNDQMIQKFTPEGELLWTYEYATEQDPDYVNTIIPTSDGGGGFFGFIDGYRR